MIEIVKAYYSGQTTWMSLLIVAGVMMLASGAGAFFGEYLGGRGKNLATRADFDILLEQQKKTAEAVQEISRKDRLLAERYALVRQINELLDDIRVNFDRLRKGQPTTLEIVGGETRLLTRVDSYLRLNQALLTATMHELLRSRYDLVRLLWKQESESEWGKAIAEDNKLNDDIQSEIAKSFAYK